MTLNLLLIILLPIITIFIIIFFFCKKSKCKIVTTKYGIGDIVIYKEDNQCFLFQIHFISKVNDEILYCGILFDTVYDRKHKLHLPIYSTTIINCSEKNLLPISTFAKSLNDVDFSMHTFNGEEFETKLTSITPYTHIDN